MGCTNLWVRFIQIFLLFRPQSYVFLVALSRSFFRQREVQPAVAMNVRGNEDPPPTFRQFREAELQKRIVDIGNVF